MCSVPLRWTRCRAATCGRLCKLTLPVQCVLLLLIPRKRAIMEGIVKWAGKALTPLNERMRGLAPEQVARLPTTINVALVAALCDAVGWPDTLLPAKLLFGSPTTGDLPSSHVMRPKERRATTDPCVFDVDGWADSLHVSVEQRGRRMSAKARATATALLAKSIDEAAPDAAGRSWSTGPLSLGRRAASARRSSLESEIVIQFCYLFTFKIFLPINRQTHSDAGASSSSTSSSASSAFLCLAVTCNTCVPAAT